MSETQLGTALAEYRNAIRHQNQAAELFAGLELSIDQLADSTSAPADRPLPLEFDHNGFPLAQRRPDFATRVARLRDP